MTYIESAEINYHLVHCFLFNLYISIAFSLKKVLSDSDLEHVF